MSDREIIALCEQECQKNNLQFDEDWVNINRLYGYATVINDSGRIIARIDI